MSRQEKSSFEKLRAKIVALVYIGDLFIIVLSMFLGYWIRFEFFSEFRAIDEFPTMSSYYIHCVLSLGVYTVVGRSQRIFRWGVMTSRMQSASIVSKVVLLWAFSVVGLSLMLGLGPPISRFFMLCSMGFLFALMQMWRALIYWGLMNLSWVKSSYKNVAIVGTGESAVAFASRMDSGEAGLNRFVGFFSGHLSKDDGGQGCSDRVIGSFELLMDGMGEYSLDCLIVVDSELLSVDLQRIAKLCERNFVEFRLIPSHFEVFNSCLKVYNMGDVPVISLTEVPQNRLVNRAVKRGIDVVGSILGLLISLPIYAVLVPLVKRESSGPVFYRQVRVGQRGKRFNIYKIRSMKVDSESDGVAGWTTVDDPRKTKIGTFMRKWNLDEIPQFWNVIKGEMSLVGPRPERPELIEDFLDSVPYYQSRHSVKPGMTGWAQVNGLRGDTSIEERIRYDLDYIEKWSIWMDLSINIRTIFNYKGAC